MIKPSSSIPRRPGYMLLWAVSIIGFITSGVSPMHAELVASLFAGKALTEDSDVRLHQTGGTSLTFHGGRFEGRDFEMPIYYGGRLLYYLDREKTGFGFGVEFFHAKAYLKTSDTVHVTGTRDGVPVDDNELISDSIQNFNNSHGLNFLTADATYRFVFRQRDSSFLGRIQPYLGAGLGAVIPHVEASVGGISVSEYQIHGPGVQAFTGINFDITHHVSIFGEYKFSYADLEERIPGGSIGYEPHTHSLLAGISLNF